MAKKKENPETVIIKAGSSSGSTVWRDLLLALFFVGLAVAAIAIATHDPEPRPEPEVWPGWPILGYTILGLIGLLLVALIGYAVFRLFLSAHMALHEFRRERAAAALEIERQATHNGTQAIKETLDAAHLPAWAAHGRMGALVRQTSGGWQVINLDAEAGSVMLRDDGSIDRAVDDELSMAQLAARHQLEVERARASAHPQLQTYQHRIQTTGAAAQAPVELTGPDPWPGQVLLRDLTTGRHSLENLVLGVTVDENGIQHPVTAPLAKMVHVAVGGSSGWGKSVMLRALALQLATAVEPCELALIDLEKVTFEPFANGCRLLWPIADTPGQAVAIAEELVGEFERRKRLYLEYPGIDSLDLYNRRAREPLSPIVCLVDEATALLGDRSVQTAMRTLAQRARKYGIWLVLGGQSWRASHIDPATRDMLSTRIQFHAASASQSRLLIDDGAAAAIEAEGRAYARIPGRPLTQIQAPFVDGQEVLDALDGQDGPAYDAPPAVEAPDGEDQRAQILQLAGQGLSKNAIQREIFGYVGGAAFEAVSEALADTTTTDAGNNGRG